MENKKTIAYEKYSVCGFSKKHGYYRTKLDTFDTEAEAIELLKQKRLDDRWRISTIIVREIFYEGNNTLSSDRQQRIWACSCKSSDSRIYSKSDFGSFTY